MKDKNNDKPVSDDTNDQKSPPANDSQGDQSANKDTERGVLKGGRRISS